jgi:hypothetical protein
MASTLGLEYEKDLFRRQWFNIINNPSGNETGGKKEMRME